MDKEFYDLCYEAWHQGKNPDAVSCDRYDDAKARGYYPDEITLAMVYLKERDEEAKTEDG